LKFALKVISGAGSKLCVTGEHRTARGAEKSPKGTNRLGPKGLREEGQRLMVIPRRQGKGRCLQSIPPERDMIGVLTGPAKPNVES